MQNIGIAFSDLEFDALLVLEGQITTFLASDSCPASISLFFFIFLCYLLSPYPSLDDTHFAFRFWERYLWVGPINSTLRINIDINGINCLFYGSIKECTLTACKHINDNIWLPYRKSVGTSPLSPHNRNDTPKSHTRSAYFPSSDEPETDSTPPPQSLKVCPFPISQFRGTIAFPPIVF
jgi:hypothetical protein